MRRRQSTAWERGQKSAADNRPEADDRHCEQLLDLQPEQERGIAAHRAQRNARRAVHQAEQASRVPAGARCGRRVSSTHTPNAITASYTCAGCRGTPKSGVAASGLEYCVAHGSRRGDALAGAVYERAESTDHDAERHVGTTASRMRRRRFGSRRSRTSAAAPPPTSAPHNDSPPTLSCLISAPWVK